MLLSYCLVKKTLHMASILLSYCQPITTQPVVSWSIYGRSVRTNNDVEGWHHRLNIRSVKGNLLFYPTITILYGEAREISTQIKIIREGMLRWHQSSVTKKTQGRLAVLWECYAAKDISTARMLKTCAKLVGLEFVNVLSKCAVLLLLVWHTLHPVAVVIVSSVCVVRLFIMWRFTRLSIVWIVWVFVVHVMWMCSICYSFVWNSYF